jgi:hypothetical protein
MAPAVVYVRYERFEFVIEADELLNSIYAWVPVFPSGILDIDNVTFTRVDGVHPSAELEYEASLFVFEYLDENFPQGENNL